MKKQILLFGVLAIMAAGCGLKASHNESSTSMKYSYEENGCPTGEHSASSLQEYCRNLADEELNDFCAEDLRKSDFDSRCKDSGVDWDA